MDALWVELHLSESDFEMVFQGVKTGEDAVMEGLFPQFVPEVLDRVEFWRIGRQVNQPKVVRQGEGLALMPAGPVEYHDDPVAGVA